MNSFIIRNSLSFFIFIFCCQLKAQNNHFLFELDNHKQLISYYNNLIKKERLDYLIDITKTSSEITGDTVNLYFSFRQNSLLDSVIALWATANRNCLAQRKEDILELLYGCGVNYFEISPSNFQIIIGGGMVGAHCPYYLISGEANTSKNLFKKDSIICKNQIGIIEVDAPKFSEQQKLSMKQKKKNIQQISNWIKEYFEITYAKQKKCPQRNPKISEPNFSNNNVFTITLTDLCDAALVNTLWVKKLGIEKRERFIMKFIYTETDDGYSISMDVQGMVGSGIWSNIEIAGYNNMEPDYTQQLKEYTDSLSNELQKFLTKKSK